MGEVKFATLKLLVWTWKSKAGCDGVELKIEKRIFHNFEISEKKLKF